MDKQKILIVGADGQLAFDLIRVLKPDYDLIQARYTDFDVSDFSRTRTFIAHAHPDIVINTAAYNKTEEAERDPEKVRWDVINEFIGIDKARDTYHVVIDPASLDVDIEKTFVLRSSQGKA